MEKTVQAVYENGVLRPLEPLLLGEQQQVTVTISDRTDTAPNHPLLVSSEEWSNSIQDDIGLDEVRRALSTIRGSLSEAVLEERRERQSPNYFFDTSALAKVYRKEAGSAFVDRILSEPNSQHIVSRLTIVEMESVLALKVRTREIDQQSLLIARRRLEADLGQRRFLVAAINDEHFRTARRLLLKHGTVKALRTLDALQLSVALVLKQAGLVTVLVAADQGLCRVAELEGFAVMNPEQPASIVI